MTEQIMTDRERTALQLSRAHETLEKVWPMIEEEGCVTETTESKHTPGPWKAERRGDSDVNGREWEVRNEAREPITGWGCVRQTEVNARLIAAAPDLLQACKRALHLVEDEDNNKLIVEMPGSFGLLLDLQNAIEKATGEKP